MNITRPRAHDLIIRLVEDPRFRAQLEADPDTVLAEHGIEVGPGTLPEQVSLPEPDAIREFLHVAESRILPETASPLGLLVVIIAIGAMPLLAGDHPVLDGTG